VAGAGRREDSVGGRLVSGKIGGVDKMQIKCECELTCATAGVAVVGGATGAASEGAGSCCCGGGSAAVAAAGSAASVTAPRGVTAPALSAAPTPAAMVTASAGLGVTSAGAAAAGAGAHPAVSGGGGAEGSNGTLGGSFALEFQNMATSGTDRGGRKVPLWIYSVTVRAAQYRRGRGQRHWREPDASQPERVRGDCVWEMRKARPSVSPASRAIGWHLRTAATEHLS